MILKKLAIITTHPIQYNAPVFAMLQKREKIILKVFYTWGEEVLNDKYDPGFGKIIEWDIPLLEGYEFEFVKNVAPDPGSHHFYGIQNPTLIQQLKEWHPDAILIFGWNFKGHLHALHYFHNRLPVYFRGDSTLLDEAGVSLIKKMFKSVLLKWVYRYVDKAFYVGQCNKDYFLKYGLKENQLLFAPHAIDNNRFGRAKEVDYRKIHNIPEEAIVFLFAGKLETKKNPMILLKAFAELSNCNAWLMIVGNGVSERELKDFSNSLQGESNSQIIFLDFQNQSVMPDIYKAADIFVLPSKGPNETWGLSVNEAMASACAVLVSDKCGCFPDLVKEGENGFVFSSTDKSELVFKMKKLIAGKEHIKKMGLASQQKIKNWSFEKVCFVIEEELASFHIQYKKI
jgi:glycosyltransferase involved in cell wall biosynthesis